MKTVVVGMSGGVDSAVCALLLKQQGYNVIGLFMRNWDSSINQELNNTSDFDEICPQEQDYNDALKTCEHLNIPLKRVDFIKEYWDFVFKHFLNELKKGRTPNPDLLCNKYIKFDLFKDEAYKLGADYIATGHYARIKNNKLLKGIDYNKDQTYFLASLSQNQLKDIMFPLGEYKKEDIRKIAKEHNLPVATKRDSTGICFIGEKNFQKFISNYLKKEEGDIIDLETNKSIGTHFGVVFYTIGQRKNLGLDGVTDKYYVCGKNIKSNILYVSKNQHYLESDEVIIENFNKISSNVPAFCRAKFRYRSKEVDVIVEFLEDNHIKLKYPSKSKSVTPGQACVLYLGDECIGGGTISKVYKEGEPLWFINN